MKNHSACSLVGVYPSGIKFILPCPPQCRNMEKKREEKHRSVITW